MDRYTAPDYARSALITIDTQNDFTLPHGASPITGTREILPNLRLLLIRYRWLDLPIIHIVRLYLLDGSNADLCRRETIENGHKIVAPGTPGAELVDEIKPDRKTKLDPDLLLSGEWQEIGHKEYILFKPRWGAFYATRLEKLLKILGVNTLVFAGCNYPNCPRSSIYEASERDFRIVLARDAISQIYPKGEVEMRNIGVSLPTTSELLSALGPEKRDVSGRGCA